MQIEKRKPLDIRDVREITNQYDITLYNKEIDKINEAIDKAAALGNNCVWLHKFIPSKTVRKEFENAGYTIEIFYGDMSDNKDHDTLVKW